MSCLMSKLLQLLRSSPTGPSPGHCLCDTYLPAQTGSTSDLKEQPPNESA